VSELSELLASTGFVAPWLVTVMLLMWAALGVRTYALRAPARLDPDGLMDAAPGGTTLVQVAVVQMVEEARRRGPGLHRGHLDAVAAPFVDALGAGAVVVSITAAVAPLMGLLGTVTGMIETFDSLAEMALFTRSGGIGAGIGEAMLSTQMGLVVALPGLLFGAMLERRYTTLLDALAGVAERLAATVPVKEAA